MPGSPMLPRATWARPASAPSAAVITSRPIRTSSTCGGTPAFPGRPSASIVPSWSIRRMCTSRAPTSIVVGSRARCSPRWVPTAMLRTRRSSRRASRSTVRAARCPSRSAMLSTPIRSATRWALTSSVCGLPPSTPAPTSPSTTRSLLVRLMPTVVSATRCASCSPSSRVSLSPRPTASPLPTCCRSTSSWSPV